MHILLLALASVPAAADTADWLEPPRLAVMTGFIFDPPTGTDIEGWAAGMGENFDPEAWVQAFNDAGAAYLIFYDKWIDGLVFHDTNTTSYKTPRDYLREVSDACAAGDLPLVIYWNAAYDDNPEFAEYVTRHADGTPIKFPGAWPCNLLSMHSPFRQLAQDQVREILRDYAPIAGLWQDVHSQPSPVNDPFAAAPFRQRYGVEIAAASPEQLAGFSRATLIEYQNELRAIAGELQPDLRFTTNGAAAAPMGSPLMSSRFYSQLQFLSAEGHSFWAMDAQAAAADMFLAPMETGNLISSSWFTPLQPMAEGRARRALAEGAIAWCQGANVYYAMSPNHDGVLGQGEVDAILEAGDWLADNREHLAGSRAWPDVGIILGAPDPGMVSAGGWGESVGLLRALNRMGYGGRIIWELPGMAEWPTDLSRFRALVVMDGAPLGDKHVRRLERYVEQGGSLLVFGNGARVDADGSLRGESGLAKALGLRAAGAAEFPAAAYPPVCFSDSEYGQGYHAANLADGTPAAWASAETPMPHWAQVNLPVEQPVARVRVVTRSGGYLLTDLDTLTWNGEDWDLVQSYPDNTETTIDLTLDEPVNTLGVRVHVRAATYLGEPRELADIEEIEVYAADGELLTGGSLNLDCAAPMPETLAGPAWVAEVRRAEVIAEFTDPQSGAPRPLVTQHRFGEGTTIWVAVRAAACQVDGALEPIVRLAIGRPTVTRLPRDSRHRVVLREMRQGELAVCVVDPSTHLPPASLELRVRADGVARTELTVTPDPAAVVLVQ